ncbi:hypothetical protein I317_00479 [Kwoniella heveanensis CBS 569]|nr:hypothetical protein I317_00479 [Kwoniella heveanensis CBS 569]
MNSIHHTATASATSESPSSNTDAGTTDRSRQGSNPSLPLYGQEFFWEIHPIRIRRELSTTIYTPLNPTQTTSRATPDSAPHADTSAGNSPAADTASQAGGSIPATASATEGSAPHPHSAASPGSSRGVSRSAAQRETWARLTHYTAELDRFSDTVYTVRMRTFNPERYAAQSTEKKVAIAKSQDALADKIQTALQRRVLSIHSDPTDDTSDCRGDGSGLEFGTKHPYTMEDERDACYEAVQRIAENYVAKHPNEHSALFVGPPDIPGSVLYGSWSQDMNMRARASAKVDAYLDPSTGHQSGRERLEIDRGWEDIVASADKPMTIRENVAWGKYMRSKNAQAIAERQWWEEECPDDEQEGGSLDLDMAI